METDYLSEKPFGLFFGKKTYCINARMARKKAAGKLPDCGNEEKKRQPTSIAIPITDSLQSCDSILE